MGVSGLWDVVRPAAISRSFAAIAVDGFAQHETEHPTRGFRIGIDASIWFVHSNYGKEGENPELRTIFFRLTRLLKLPFLPLFVFDGPMRPAMKRGKMIDTKPHWMIEDMKRMIRAFGFEWRNVRILHFSMLTILTMCRLLERLKQNWPTSTVLVSLTLSYPTTSTRLCLGLTWSYESAFRILVSLTPGPHHAEL